MIDLQDADVPTAPLTEEERNRQEIDHEISLLARVAATHHNADEYAACADCAALRRSLAEQIAKQFSHGWLP